MEWSDIRIFLHVARAGTMIGAARTLRMDHATVSRRIARLEHDTDMPLFERAGKRLTLTAEGEKMLETAGKIESTILRDVQSIASAHDRIVGPVRIGTTEDFGAHYLAPRLAALTAAHPGLEIELVVQPAPFSLAAREADLMVSLDRPVTGDIRFKQLTRFEFGVYGAASYFTGRKRPVRKADLWRETWCCEENEPFGADGLAGYSGVPTESGMRYRTRNVSVQLGAALGGSALALLPCFVAGSFPALERLVPDEPVSEGTYWLAVHADLANSPRVRAVMTAIEEQTRKDAALFRPSALMRAFAGNRRSSVAEKASLKGQRDGAPCELAGFSSAGL